MSGDHLYVYGVVEDGPLELSIEGVNGATPVHTVEHGPHYAVVTDIDELEPERTDENARAHDEVLRTVIEEGHTVVPMQFGMVFKNARALKNVMRSGRRAFTSVLRDVEGKVELGVKVVVDEDAELARETVAEAAEDLLTPHSEGEVENDLFSDRLALNRSYLVDRDDREQFDQAVAEFEDEFDDRALVQYTGPWAPYNFVDIEIAAEQ